MSTEKIFLKPRLEGARFDDHLLPVGIMEDFSVLEELIFDLAKKIYIEKNPTRKRVPNHFTENVSVKLKSIEEGSVIPAFALVAITAVTNPTLPTVSNDYFHYFEAAKEKVFEIVEKANLGEVADVDVKYLNYFNRIGRNLRDDESIDLLNDKSSERNVVLNRNTRRKILLSRNEKFEYSEKIQEIVLISSVSQRTKKFEVEIEGSAFECFLDKEFQDTVLNALNGYDKNCYVSLKGVGIFNEHMKLIHIDKIESLDILDPFDVSIRLKELSKLEDNWYNGNDGKKLNIPALNNFELLFDSCYDINLPLPAIFPTLSGDLLLEWKKDDISISIEVDLSNLQASIFFFDMSNDDNDREDKVNLNETMGWDVINKIILKVV